MLSRRREAGGGTRRARALRRVERSSGRGRGYPEHARLGVEHADEEFDKGVGDGDGLDEDAEAVDKELR